jgi:hypothetical protein
VHSILVDSKTGLDGKTDREKSTAPTKNQTPISWFSSPEPGHYNERAIPAK